MEFLKSCHHCKKQQLMKKLLWSVSILLLFTAFQPNALMAKTITGLVKDKDSGRPIPGVSVTSGSGKATANTDKNGKYTIDIEATENSLKFSMIGYNNAIIKLNGSRVVNISMAQSSASLSEIVVMGYSDTKAKRAVTASAAVALEGRVSGVSTDRVRSEAISKSIASSVAKKAGPVSAHPGKVKPQSNQLTAGEWNDLEHWDFWKDLMNNQEWSANQPKWQFYTNNRISINLKNKQQKPLINYTVTALRNGSPLWKAQTNFEGKVELWPSLFSNEQEELTLAVTDVNGKTLYNKNISSKTRNMTLAIDRPAENIKNLDVMFMVDATGSMGDEISYLKSELEDIIGRLNGGNNLNTRTSLVFYRDKGDDYVVRDFGFDGDIRNVKRNLAKQEASGGGDFEEAVEEAMENAIYQQRWSTTGPTAKLMFMILDAPPHYDAARVKSIQRSVREAAAKGIALIPVVASGIDKNTEFLMRFMALSTNGTYVFLTDDSGIGNIHLKPTVGSYQVEYLNQLLNRLINKYTGLEANMAEDLLSSTKK
jgi:hypothetical protein